MAPNQSSAAQQLQMNQQLRALLLQSAPRMRKDLGVTTGALGQTSRIQIFNVGLLTSLQVAVSCPVTIGVANATPSPRAPYNLINRVRLTDYDGTDRVNWSGFQLFVLNCVRARIPYGVNNEGPIVTAQGSSVLGGVITNPNTPTQVGNGTISYLLDIPVCYDPEADLRGMILAQTAVGTMYLSVDWNANLILNGANASVDAVYNGAATSTVVMQAGIAGPSIQVWQEYLMPQAINGQLPLPMIDLQTVYEMAGNLRDNSNLAVNTEKLLNYPNVRSVIGAYFCYINGVNNMLATDINKFRLIANGNNILRDDTLFSQQVRQRNYLEGDIAFGTYFYLHRSKPVETALFGNVQAGITPNVVNASALIEFGYESFYTKGSALPGISQ
jgi:hypothetical protein